MDIYVDVILIENFVINLFLLTVTFKIMHMEYKKIMIYISATIGSLYTLTMVIDEAKFLTIVPIQILMAFVMIYIATINRQLKIVIKLVGIFILLSFLLAGITFGFAITQNEYRLTENFVISSYSIKYIMLSLMALYIVVARVAEYLKERGIISNLYYDISMKVKDKTVLVRGFLDTGNELREPISNLPCIIVEQEYLRELQFSMENTYYINYSTIGESGKLQGFKCDELRIKSKNDNWKKIDAIICKGNNKLSQENDYQALLSRGII